MFSCSYENSPNRGIGEGLPFEGPGTISIIIDDGFVKPHVGLGTGRILALSDDYTNKINVDRDRFDFTSWFCRGSKIYPQQYHQNRDNSLPSQSVCKLFTSRSRVLSDVQPIKLFLRGNAETLILRVQLYSHPSPPAPLVVYSSSVTSSGTTFHFPASARVTGCRSQLCSHPTLGKNQPFRLFFSGRPTNTFWSIQEKAV